MNYSVRETHQIAEAQQEKNAKLREAFGISEYFVEGSSFDPERKAKETLAKGTALQEELQAQRNAEREKNKKYALVRTPSPSKDRDDDNDGKKKKKKKKRDGWVFCCLVIFNKRNNQFIISNELQIIQSRPKKRQEEKVKEEQKRQVSKHNVVIACK